MNNSYDVFREEAYELLGELEAALLALEENKEDAESINRVFRVMHTLKGSGGMFGLDDIAAFTHELETVFDLVREGRMAVTEELINLTLAAGDQIKQMLDAPAGADGIDDEACRTLIRGLKQLAPDNGQAESETTSDVRISSDNDDGFSDQDRGETIYHIRFKPHAHLFKTGANPLLLLDELRQMGPCTIMAQTDAIPPLEEIDPETCYTGWEIYLATVKDTNAIMDVFIFVEEDCDLDVRVIDSADSDEAGPAAKKIGEILIERGDLNTADLNEALLEQRRIGQVLVSRKMVAKSAVEAALIEQEYIKQRREKKVEILTSSSIRVASDKLDALVDLVGELVTVQASLSRKASTQEDAELVSISEKVERLTADLRGNAMGMRMMPIGTNFQKFKRLVRDLSNDLGKEVLLGTEGGETELDKTVIDQLNDSLIHIIRNSIDHGIEPADIREGLGKSRKGTIHLSAVHAGAKVHIKITDDGKGLDPESIYRKAVEKGIIPADATLSENEIFSLIFAPGFSTAASVTDVSGRGVGMDVVKRSIEALRGSIEIESEKGLGTTITLKLPLTLAIIEGLLMQIGETHFVLPLNSVDECVELTREAAISTNGQHLMNVRNEVVPYVPLRELFDINGDKPPIEQIVITEQDGQRVGFVVDQIIGEHQTVIKNLGKTYKDAQGFAGATILADGTVALILDVKGVLDVARMDEPNT